MKSMINKKSFTARRRPRDDCLVPMKEIQSKYGSFR